MRTLFLLLLAGCSSAYAGPATPEMLDETIWTGIKDGQSTGTTSGQFSRCYQNSDCASLCCVGHPICETCVPFTSSMPGAGEAVCVPAKLCQGG